MSQLVSDPAIAEKYEEVRSDKSDTNWSVCPLAVTADIVVQTDVSNCSTPVYACGEFNKQVPGICSPSCVKDAIRKNNEVLSAVQYASERHTSRPFEPRHPPPPTNLFPHSSLGSPSATTPPPNPTNSSSPPPAPTASPSSPPRSPPTKPSSATSASTSATTSTASAPSSSSCGGAGPRRR